MNRNIIEEIISIARFYPSGDNCQPLRFKIQGEEVIIRYIYGLGRHAMSFNEFPTLISLGFCIEYFQQASLNKGYEIAYELLTDSFVIKEDCDLVKIKFKKSEKSARYADEILTKRYVDRRPLSIAFNTNEIESIEAINNFYMKKNLSDDFIDKVSKSDSKVYLWFQAIYDLVSWIHYPWSKLKVGLPWRNLGISFAEYMPIILMKSSKFFIHLFSNKISAFVYEKTMNKIHRQSFAHLLFTFKNDWGANEKIQAIRNMANVWFEITKYNGAIQPHTLLTIFNYPTDQSILDKIDNETAFSVQDHLQKIQTLNKEFNVKDGEYPVWLWRIGRPVKAIEDNCRTDRLSIEELIIN